MKWSLYLGRVAGIKLYIHWTFLLLVGWVFMVYFRLGYGFTQALVGLGFVFTIFACVILHELGHALAARKYKIVTKNITILPIGGLANMERLPEEPGRELWVAVAGPLVNVVLAAILFAIMMATGGLPKLDAYKVADEGSQGLMMAGGFVFNLFTINLMLVLFNLIPAFPMDGGRMLRALLSYRMDRAKATRVAATIGQFLAIGFVFLGLFSNIWLVLIGVFIFLGAGGEAAFETTKSILGGYKVRDVLMTKFTPLKPLDTLDQAVQILLDSQEQEFLVVDNGMVHGVLTRKNLIGGLHRLGNKGRVAEAMQETTLQFHPDMDLKEAFQQLLNSPCSVAPVLEGDQLVGIIDKENINELLLVRQALERDA